MSDSENVSIDEVDQALLRAIKKQAESASNAQTLLRLAEASAWIQKPDQVHGGANATSPS